MAIRTKDELIAAYNALIGDRTDDAALSMLEDISDTFADMEAASKTDWEAKYLELDGIWRERYRQRFSDTGNSGEDVKDVSVEAGTDSVPEPGKTSFTDLFDTK